MKKRTQRNTVHLALYAFKCALHAGSAHHYIVNVIDRLMYNIRTLWLPACLLVCLFVCSACRERELFLCHMRAIGCTETATSTSASTQKYCPYGICIYTRAYTNTHTHTLIYNIISPTTTSTKIGFMSSVSKRIFHVPGDRGKSRFFVLLCSRSFFIFSFVLDDAFLRVIGLE